MQKRVFANRFTSTKGETLIHVKLPSSPQACVELFLVLGVPARPFGGLPRFDSECLTGFKKVM